MQMRRRLKGLNALLSTSRNPVSMRGQPRILHKRKNPISRVTASVRLRVALVLDPSAAEF